LWFDRVGEFEEEVTLFNLNRGGYETSLLPIVGAVFSASVSPKRFCSWLPHVHKRVPNEASHRLKELFFLGVFDCAKAIKR
jgi:hypothetical protein